MIANELAPSSFIWHFLICSVTRFAPLAQPGPTHLARPNWYQPGPTGSKQAQPEIQFGIFHMFDFDPKNIRMFSIYICIYYIHIWRGREMIANELAPASFIWHFLICSVTRFAPLAQPGPTHLARPNWYQPGPTGSKQAQPEIQFGIFDILNVHSKHIRMFPIYIISKATAHLIIFRFSYS